MKGTAEWSAFEGAFGWVGRLIGDWTQSLRRDTNPASRALRSWVAPLERARNADELSIALEECTVATIALSDTLARTLPTGHTRVEAAADALQKLPWALSRATSRLGEETVVGEYVALLQLHLTVAFEAVGPEISVPHEHAAKIAAVDLSSWKADPLAWPFLQGNAGFWGVLCLHEFDLDPEGWRRRALLGRGLDALRAASSHLPVPTTFEGIRHRLAVARRCGLWPRSLKPTDGGFEEMLTRAPANKTALETLRARFGASSAWVYLGDVEVTAASLLRELYAAVDAGLQAGEQFERGGASIGELAHAWTRDVPGMLKMLDQLGFVRRPEVLRLSEDDRQARLAKLRADRLLRGGAPRPDLEVVDRAVLASQRIEGIDARGHLEERLRGGA